MENRINVAEILKKCPKGMELYSPIYGLGTLTKVTDRIHVKFPKEHNVKCFRPDGKVSDDGEIMLYPKSKTTWERFTPPYNFKDGDILYVKSAFDWICIYKENESTENLYKYVAVQRQKNGYGIYKDNSCLCYKIGISEIRLATDKEKEILFKVIKNNGYKWNEETKTLDKLIEPNLKVGYRIQFNPNTPVRTIIDLESDRYILDDKSYIKFEDEHFCKVLNFDINTLVPFKSAVLIRNDNTQKWIPAFWGYKANNGHYVTTFGTCRYCIPYEGNENLLTTNNDCDDYFKTWE